jgi:hypothetical protein
MTVLLPALAACAALAVAAFAPTGHAHTQLGPDFKLAGAKRGIASGTNELFAGSKPGVSPGSGTGAPRAA